MTAEEVGLLARRLTTGLYVHAAALEIARDAWTLELPPPVTVSEDGTAGYIPRKDGTLHAYDWPHHVRVARSDSALTEDLDRVWLFSALLVLADRLDAENYFDRAPLLEMVRHLRNGIAHGNRFAIREPAKLLEWPAHTREAAARSPSGETFEITPDLDGRPVLFDFMGAGDVLDVLISVGTHLLPGQQRRRRRNAPPK